MTGQTRRKPSVRTRTPRRTAATHASGADEFSCRFALDEGLRATYAEFVETRA